MNEKIEEACYYKALCNGNYKETKKYINISEATLRKYTKLGENLDFELRELLDRKGKNKLTIGLALKFCEIVNKEHQYSVYLQLSSRELTNKEKINCFEDYLDCNICCDKSYLQEKLPCCGNIICVKCLYKTVSNMINDVAFAGCKCPFCNSYFSKDYIYNLLSLNRNSNKLYTMDREIYFNRRYYRNLWRKMRAIIEQVEIMKGKMIGPSMNFKELVSDDEKEKYYGVCIECCPPVPKFQTQVFNHIKVNTVDRECADGEGNMVVLNNHMFKCENCGDKDNEYKKCPHCGIKTLRPDACNYVICGDHRWCWICNERLPNNHEGHNVHYWTGPGTSPYSNHCRRSINYNRPDFVMDCCDCSACSPYSGLKLCNALECYNRCENPGDTICNKCKEI